MVRKLVSLLLIFTLIVCNVGTMAFADSVMGGHTDENIVESGWCGYDVSWYFYKDGTLKISGKGSMNDYDMFNTPWEEYKGEITKVVLENITKIGEYAFSGCSGLTGDLVIPESVTSIGDCAFERCNFTGDLVLPEKLTSVGSGAFFGCSGLTGDLVIPESVTSIGDSAFYNCYGLTGNLVIPEGVTSIGHYAFYNCYGLTGNLVIPEGVTSIGESAFYNCNGFTGDLVLPEKLTSIGGYAFDSCNFTGDLVLPEKLTSVGWGAFSGCNFTGELVIPKSVTSIGDFAFYGCKGIQYITLFAKTANIDENAFSGVEAVFYIPSDADNLIQYVEDNNFEYKLFEEVLSEVTSIDYEGPYDGSEHSIVVNIPEGSTITYSTSEYGPYSETKPTLTDVGTLTVYYKVEKENYKFVKGCGTVNITHGEMKDVKSTDYIHIYDGKAHSFMLHVLEGSTVTYSTSVDGPYSETKPTLTDVGTLTVYYMIENENYVTAFGSTTIIVTPKVILQEEDIILEYSEIIYSGQANNPKVKHIGLSDENFTVEVEYENNIDAGIAKVIVKGVNNCEGTVTKTFTIKRNEITDANLSYSDTVYDGTQKKPQVTIEGLKEGKDFTVEYKNNVEIGNGEVIITGINNYTGTITKTFEISIPDDYIKIYTKKDLYNIRSNRSGKYILMNNITLTESDFKSGGVFSDSFDQCMIYGTFSGVFDGNGHTITGIRSNVMNTSGSYTVFGGMFETVSGTVKNLNVINCNIMPMQMGTGPIVAGTIAGCLDGGKIFNCNASGKVSAGAQNAVIMAGGIVGYSKGGTITDCTSECSVNGFSNSTSDAGGIVGYNLDGTVERCVNTGEVISSGYDTATTGITSAGGISGSSTGNIYDCYNEGKIRSFYATGGIVGHITEEDATISRCYNTGNISISSKNTSVGGGIAGSIEAKCIIKDCFNLGTLLDDCSSVLVLGGIVGSTKATSIVNNCYNVGGFESTGYIDSYNTGEITGDGNAVINNCYYLDKDSVGDKKGVALSAAKLLDANNFAGFDFGKTWTINNSDNSNYLLPQLGGRNISLPEISSIGNQEIMYGNCYDLSANSIPRYIDIISSDENVFIVNDDKIQAVGLGTANLITKSILDNHEVTYDIKVTPYVLTEEDIDIKNEYVYSGSYLTPVGKIGGLTEGVDYSIYYESNKNVGTAIVTIEGNGTTCTGIVEKGFNIVSKEIVEAKLEYQDIAYDGTAKKPIVTIEGLKEGEDFEVMYSNNVEVGEAVVAVSGINNCNGTVVKTFKIVEKAPANVKISIVQETGKPKITWNPVEGIDKYDIYVATSKNGTYTYLASTSNTYFIDTNSQAGICYYYKVKSVSDKGKEFNSNYSDYCYMTCDLAQPTNVKVANVESSGKPKITWTAVSGADKYYVYRSTSKNGTYSYLGSTTNTHYTNTGAVAGNCYYYKVKAVDANNEYANSTQSDYCYITCDLAKPTNVKVNNVASSGKPKITWTAVSGADKYYIYRSTSANGTFSFFDSTTNTSYTNTGAYAGTCYYYKVKAVMASNENANSAQSDYCYITCDLAKPTNVKVSNVASSGKPKVTWNAVTGANKYYVYRSTSKDGTYSYLGSTTNTYYNNTGAVAGTCYYYKVKAVMTSNENATSAQSSYCYITCDLAKPTNVKITLSNNKPKITWNAVSGASKYEVYRKVGDSGTYTKFYTTTSTSFTNTGATKGTKYYYKIVAVCGTTSYGNSAYSSEVSITSK